MADTGLQLRTTVTQDNTLQLSLEEVPVPQPGPDEVLVKVEAAPVNPSDLALLLGPADLSSGRVSGSAERPVVTYDIPADYMPMVAARVGQSLPVGNEGAGTVVGAGDSPQAQALMGKTVGVFGGEMFGQYRCVPAFLCLELEEGTTAVEGASCVVNPLTSLAMVETLRMEGHKAMIHTAAASNLGQMLNRICLADGVDLINIVRKPEQVEILKRLGAKYVINSSEDDFYPALTTAIRETGATLAFDATGGGKLANQVMTCMENAAASEMSEYNRYGSDTYKQLYIYGRLDLSPTVLTLNYGFAWGIGGFLLTHFLQKVGLEKAGEMRARVAREIKTPFASHYAREVSLAGALDLDTIAEYNRKATGDKFLIKPWD
ncbi:MAG: zinc-binding dehydrogenase [Halieaceae bacterium]|jgi:NADPH:quinone reductase-like Zn-dependent oxidoreductase|nr:zinc-binding dehydrogenase [Halieaceae bacterium]